MKKLLKENQGIKTDTFIDKINADSSELIKEINTMIILRKKYNITQEEMSWACKVSLPTIKRFETFKVDSLSLYMNYKAALY